MTLDKFTIKAQEAVQQAANTAQLSGQQAIEQSFPQLLQSFLMTYS